LWLKIARNKRIQNKQICDYLLDQKRISGIGNYLRSEILYRSRIRPDRSLKNLSDEELELLRIESIKTVRESYDSHGLTIRSYSDLYGNKGTFICQVYNRTEDPYGNPIRTDTFKDGRTIHWVPSLQH